MTSAVVTTDTSALPGVDETYAVFVHLNAEKSPLYRAILAVFVAERARFTLALRPSEIQAALVATSASTLPPRRNRCRPAPAARLGQPRRFS
jgi:hypothetical protein